MTTSRFSSAWLFEDGSRSVRHHTAGQGLISEFHQEWNPVPTDEDRTDEQSVQLWNLTNVVRVDVLHRTHGEFLEQEEKKNLEHLPTLRQLSRVPYPMNDSVAQMLSAERQRFVLPWSVINEQVIPHLAMRTLNGNSFDPISPEDWKNFFDKVEAAIRALVAEGEMEEGTIVFSDDIPFSQMFAKRTSLIHNTWIDEGWLKLAEYGKTLKNQGFIQLPSLDRHLWACDRFFPSETNWEKKPHEIDVGQLLPMFCDNATSPFAVYGGPRKTIDGRSFVHFQEYRRWRGRTAPDIRISRGVLLSSWNRFLDENENGNNGTVGVSGIALRRLELCDDKYDFYQYKPISNTADFIAEMNDRREAFESLPRIRKPRKGKPGRPKDPTKAERDQLIRNEWNTGKYCKLLALSKALSAKHPKWDFSIDIVRNAIRPRK